MRILLASFLALVVMGCSTEKQLAYNRYTIETKYGGDTGYFEAVHKLTKKAENLCDEGYRKTPRLRHW